MAEPKIVFLDIETIPDLQQALEHWVDLVPPFPGKKPTMSASVTSICSFGYKILGEKTLGLNAWDFPSWREDVNDDRALCKALFQVLKDADAVVTFNGKKFDWKFIQTRLAIHGMEMLHPISHVDLCQVVRSNLFLLNGRLKTVAKYLLDDSKLDHDGWPLWVRVHGGVKRRRDKDAEAKMGRYNLKDVDLMVPLFKRFRPLIKNIPNYNLFDNGKRDVCPNCASTRLERRGVYRTSTKIYGRYRCQDCFSWSRTDGADRNQRRL